MGVMDIHTSMDKVVIFGILFVKEIWNLICQRIKHGSDSPTWVFKRSCEVEYSLNWRFTTLCGGVVLQEYLPPKLWWKRNGTL